MVKEAQVIIIGGGLAGLSAAIYLGRARRDVLLIDTGRSMARWEPDVENYLGFDRGIGGRQLLQRARRQVRQYEVRFARDFIVSARRRQAVFVLSGRKGRYTCERLLLATGIFHVPPDVPGLKKCVGRGVYFCKDCDGYRLRGKRVAVYGWTNEAAEYALQMLDYTSKVVIVTDGRPILWDRRHGQCLKERKVPIDSRTIVRFRRSRSKLEALVCREGEPIELDALFTTRGDIVFNSLARKLGAKLDSEEQVMVDPCMRTSVKHLFAAGCVTTGNCQMIIAAGQGAAAAQAISREIFEANLGL